MIKRIFSDFINLIFPKRDNSQYNWGEIIFALTILIFVIIMLILSSV